MNDKFKFFAMINAVVSLALTVTTLIVKGIGPSINTFLIPFLVGWVVAMILSYLIPTESIAKSIANALNIKQVGLMVALVTSLIFVPIITTVLVGMEIGFGADLLPAVLGALPILLVVAFAIVSLTSPTLQKIAFKN